MFPQFLALILILLVGSRLAAKSDPTIDDLCKRNQATIGSVATLYLKMRVQYDPPNFMGEQRTTYWRVGDEFRLVFQSTRGWHGHFHGLSGTLKAHVEVPSQNGSNPSNNGIIGPLGSSVLGDPETLCLLTVPGKGEWPWVSLAASMEESHRFKKQRNFSEKGREYSIISADHKKGKYEAWLSKQHNYLIGKMINWTIEDRNFPSMESEVLEFREIVPGIYFPTIISSKIFSPTDGKQRDVRTVTVEEISINQPIPKSQLNFRFPAHLMVLDQIHNKVWMTDENGETKEEARNNNGEVFTLYKGEMQPRLEEGKTGPTLEEPQSAFRWILPISFSFIVAGLCLFVIKKIRTIKKEVKFLNFERKQ